jgi:hypothetical protein
MTLWYNPDFALFHRLKRQILAGQQSTRSKPAKQKDLPRH